MTQTHQMAINGVDVDRLFQTVDAVKQMPPMARFHFRARNHWIDGGHNRSTINNYYGAQSEQGRTEPFVYDNDEPPVLLGKDQAANPVEFVLHALAGCLTSSLIYQAAARGIHIDAVDSELEGDIDLQGFLGLSDKVRNGYENIRVRFHIKSDAPRETLEELCRLAQARSPVFDTLSRPVPIDVQLAQ